MKGTPYSIRNNEFYGDMAAWLRANAQDNDGELLRLKRNLRLARQEALTARQRQLLRMNFEQNKTVTEIAQELGVNKSTVSRTLLRAKRRLYNACATRCSPRLTSARGAHTIKSTGKTGAEGMSMLHKAIQNRWCRLALAVAATLLYAIGVNWFIVPMGLYTGGLLGFCQVARTLIVEALGLSPNVDFSGVLYLAANVPILLLAWQALGRGFLVRTAVCTVTSSLFLSLVPPPAAPLVEETLTNCVLGGILVGFSLGIVLTCGCSTGGLDILGLWLAKKGKGFSVGRFSLSFNALLYTLCAVLFGLRAAIYSIIYTVFCALFIDRGHQQNITEQVLIFTKDEDPELPRNIMARLGRGVTYWEGKGAYTGEDLRVLCVCVSKFEEADLYGVVHELDPNAFFITQEGVTIHGNFIRKLS